ncbi:hypothetical protein [Arenimonas sp.]|uniref:hypothetical protein n=1 Tax=Arenimonas sp. TaxID=1872635 RepID=UPI0035B047F9
MKKLAEPVLEILKVWLGHHLARAANSLLLAGLALLSAPWWQPILYALVANHLQIDMAVISFMEASAVTTGWILVLLGIALHLANKVLPLAHTPKIEVVAHWWRRCMSDGVTKHPDLFMTVINRGEKDLPWLNVHVFPSNDFKLAPVDGPTEMILSGQYAIYRFRVVDESGAATEPARRFLEVKPEDLSIRVFKSRSADEALLVSYPLGLELHSHLNEVLTGTPDVA